MQRLANCFGDKLRPVWRDVVDLGHQIFGQLNRHHAEQGNQAGWPDQFPIFGPSNELSISRAAGPERLTRCYREVETLRGAEAPGLEAGRVDCYAELDGACLDACSGRQK